LLLNLQFHLLKWSINHHCILVFICGDYLFSLSPIRWCSAFEVFHVLFFHTYNRELIILLSLSVSAFWEGCFSLENLYLYRADILQGSRWWWCNFELIFAHWVNLRGKAVTFLIINYKLCKFCKLFHTCENCLLNVWESNYMPIFTN
jgi:hypothetical protein